MYYSQDSQDELMEEYVFKGLRNGVFVDVGAWDGVCYNNTLFFEKERNWTGINIEPLPDRYEQLIANRPNGINLNLAINDVEGEIEFLAISGDTSMLSGIKANYDPRHIQRIEKETSELHTEARTIHVQAKRLDSIFRERNIRHVNYLSVDAEGSEMNVIQSIDFDFTYIDVIGFENNYPDKTIPVIRLLESKGYKKLPLHSIDVFMIRTNSPFCSRQNALLPFLNTNK